MKLYPVPIRLRRTRRAVGLLAAVGLASVYCSHCLPCPSVIDVPRINGLLVSAANGVSENLKRTYGSVAAKASSCMECGLCSEKCPFGVDVVANMREAARLFEGKALREQSLGETPPPTSLPGSGMVPGHRL